MTSLFNQIVREPVKYRAFCFIEQQYFLERIITKLIVEQFLFPPKTRYYCVNQCNRTTCIGTITHTISNAAIQWLGIAWPPAPSSARRCGLMG
jgi:hypothetical protein